MTVTVDATAFAEGFTSCRWQAGLPILDGDGFLLREVQAEDAAPLCAQLTDEQVTRFMSAPPGTPGGFTQFIEWIQGERASGRGFCYAIVPAGAPDAVGLIQVRELDPTFSTAEWGFALARPYWATGLFTAAARHVVDFVFLCTGAHRLEARAFVENGRGNGILKKIGAVREGELRKSFKKNGEYLNQVLWSVNGDDWLAGRRLPLCEWKPAAGSPGGAGRSIRRSEPRRAGHNAFRFCTATG